MGIKYPINTNEGKKIGMEYRHVVFGDANTEAPIYIIINIIIKKCICHVVSLK